MELPGELVITGRGPPLTEPELTRSLLPFLIHMLYVRQLLMVALFTVTLVLFKMNRPRAELDELQSETVARSQLLASPSA